MIATLTLSGATGVTAAKTADAGGVSARDWVAVVGAMLGAFMAVLDIQITNASLTDCLLYTSPSPRD